MSEQPVGKPGAENGEASRLELFGGSAVARTFDRLKFRGAACCEAQAKSVLNHVPGD